MNRLITSYYPATPKPSEAGSLLTMFRWRSYFILTALALGFFALCPVARAVTPPPDGGYPGGNTAEGQNSLLSLTNGTYNTAVGVFSLESNTEGSFNTGVGAGALLANVGNENTGDGTRNTAVGAAALLSNTTGLQNTAVGAFALIYNHAGVANSAFGFNALENNDKTGSGFGSSNSAFGAFALYNNTDGGGNTAMGEALFGNTTGSANTAIGLGALSINDSGDSNTAVGGGALGSTTGSNNTALGYLAGHNLTAGDNNIDIGANVEGGAGESNTMRIGNTDITDTFIRGISGATVASGAAVLVASNGHLGTVTSSKRFKDEIKPMDKASEALLALKPVIFRYKKEIDPHGIPQFGLVAEEVEKVNRDLVVRDEQGKPYSVRYEQVNAMLLNEFLKEHKAFLEEQRKVQEQEATIAELKSGMKALAEAAKEQTGQIQWVSAQLEAVRPTLKIVENR